jgi:hypothetical protein
MKNYSKKWKKTVEYLEKAAKSLISSDIFVLVSVQLKN